MSSISTIVGGLTASALAVGGGAVAYSAITTESVGSERAQVVKVIDGDTLDVRYDGSKHRIRLLNVDTPETKDPNKAVECLGPEATAYLERQLEPGDTVRLEFDEDRYDRYDRELAGVFEDDLLVNAEIARRGLGVPALFEPNRLFYDEVVAAHEEGKVDKVGIFDPAVSCTFASRVEEYGDSVASAEAKSSLKAVQEATDKAVKDGDALIVLIDGAKPATLAAAGLSSHELEVLRDRVVQLQDRASTSSKDATAKVKAKAQAKAKKKAEEKAKKAEEEKEAEAEAKRQAEATEAQRPAKQAAPEEARRREQQAPPAPQPAPAPAPAPEPPPAPAQPGAGYTGCRAYVGGPYIDDQGRHYTPIDCDTKVPLV